MNEGSVNLATPKRQAEIRGCLNRLSEGIERCLGLFNDLEDKTISISKPQGQLDKTEDSPDSVVPICSELNSSSYRIENINQRMNELIERIEL